MIMAPKSGYLFHALDLAGLEQRVDCFSFLIQVQKQPQFPPESPANLTTVDTVVQVVHPFTNLDTQALSSIGKIENLVKSSFAPSAFRQLQVAVIKDRKFISRYLFLRA